MNSEQNYLGPDQWALSPRNEKSLKIYNEITTMCWDDLKANYPVYFERLSHTIPFASGVVFEGGCGCGNITRWLLTKKDVFLIYACDLFSDPLEKMKKFDFYDPNRIKLLNCDIDSVSFADDVMFDTIILSEIIEHIPLEKELSFLKNIRLGHIKGGKEGTKFIISTPLGFMTDPHHLRGFNKIEFIEHLEKYYGSIHDIHYTICQQIAHGYFD